MRKEAELWYLQGKKDLETAHLNFNGDALYAAAFFCQQAVEKCLKALYLHEKQIPPENTHSLTYLGRELGVPKNLWNALRELTKEYYMSRYPDASGDLPYKMYNKEETKEYLKKAQELILWVESKLKK